MEIERRETLTPSDVGLPFDDERWVVLLWRMRCRRGCVGTFRTLADRQILTDTAAMVGMDETSLEFAEGHVCLRKAVVGDPHWCAVCGWSDVVNRRGMLREHLRYKWAGEGVMREFGPLDTEVCPGSAAQPGRRYV